MVFLSCLSFVLFLLSFLLKQTKLYLRKEKEAGSQWLTLVILATQEAEIRRITDPRQIVGETLLKKTHHKKKKGW
jgi:hypothetical protein